MKDTLIGVASGFRSSHRILAQARAFRLVLWVFCGLSAELAVAKNWTGTSAPIKYWTSVACSSDGRNVVAAAAATTGELYTSTNWGAQWTLVNIPANSWQQVACSSNGATLAAVASNGGQPGPLVISTNSGATWNLSAVPTNAWASIAARPTAPGLSPSPLAFTSQPTPEPAGPRRPRP